MTHLAKSIPSANQPKSNDKVPFITEYSIPFVKKNDKKKPQSTQVSGWAESLTYPRTPIASCRTEEEFEDGPLLSLSLLSELKDPHK